MKDKTLKILRNIAITVGLSLFVLWALSGIFRAGQPNSELARTTREAVQLVKSWEHERRWISALSSIFRMLALVIGISAPLAAVYLIFRHRSRSEITPAEFLETLRQEGLIDLEKSLPFDRRRFLEEGDGGNEGEGEGGNSGNEGENGNGGRDRGRAGHGSGGSGAKGGNGGEDRGKAGDGHGGIGT